MSRKSKETEKQAGVSVRDDATNIFLLDALLDAIANSKSDLASALSDSISRRILENQDHSSSQVVAYKKSLDGEVSPVPKTTNTPAKKSKRYEERRRQILDVALESFAERGAEISLQGLSQLLEVSQPLIHRYFPTKSDLLTAVKEALQSDHWSEAYVLGLKNRSLPLEERLVNFYAAYLPSTSHEQWIRSFDFASLSDASFTQTYIGRIDKEVICTIAKEARVALGYPDTFAEPPTARELEAAWGLHSAIMLWVSRKYAYRTFAIESVEELLSDQTFAYLALAKRILSESPEMPKA